MTAVAVRATGRHHAPRKPGPRRRIKLRLTRDTAYARLLLELLLEVSWQGDLSRICLLIIGIFLGVTL